MNGAVVRGSVVFFYALIGLEIIIMISPFAAYFYAAYGPLLDFLYASQATAWLTGFFLPHAVISKSELLNFLNGFGRTLFSLNLVLFLIGAVQIYSAKFRRKGVVTGLLYRRVRHPQYLFLALAGLGLVLFWPRFLILILYLTMLFVYYLMARHEEERMLAGYGDAYLRYRHKTAMFLPGRPGKRIFTLFFGWIRSPRRALAASFAVTLLLGLALAFGLRSYSISQTSLIYLPGNQVTAISILPLSDQSLEQIVSNACGLAAVADFLRAFRQEGHRGFLVHVLPPNYRMQGLFLKSPDSRRGPMPRVSLRGILGFLFPFLTSRDRQSMMGQAQDGKFRLIFSQLTRPDGEFAPFEEALDFSVKHLPILKVDLESRDRTAGAVEKTLKRNYWGQIPLPLL